MNEKKLLTAIKLFKKRQNSDKFRVNMQERNERILYYQSFTIDKIKDMTLDDFYAYISNLWSMLIWGNKKYIVDKLINENGFEKLKEYLIFLLYGKENIEIRWDKFLTDIKGLGPSTISELLSYSNPDEYMILNKTTIKCFDYLNIQKLPIHNYQFTGKKYIEICNTAKKIAETMRAEGINKVSLLIVDFLLWDEILPLTDKSKIQIIEKEINNIKESKSLHEEIKQKVVDIGGLLGFNSNAEVQIAKGAKVDVVWEVNIGNMGTVNYVFEIQTNGSIDSLILNLLKAKNNACVQSIVAVSDAKQLEIIRQEACIDDIQKNLKYWNIEDVIEVHDCLSKAHTIINQLELVPTSLFNKD